MIDLEKFAPRGDLDPVYFDTSYYLYPDGPIAVEALRVIGAAMAEGGVIGLGAAYAKPARADGRRRAARHRDGAFHSEGTAPRQALIPQRRCNSSTKRSGSTVNKRLVGARRACAPLPLLNCRTIPRNSSHPARRQPKASCFHSFQARPNPLLLVSEVPCRPNELVLAQ